MQKSQLSKTFFMHSKLTWIDRLLYDRYDLVSQYLFNMYISHWPKKITRWWQTTNLTTTHFYLCSMQRLFKLGQLHYSCSDRLIDVMPTFPILKQYWWKWGWLINHHPKPLRILSGLLYRMDTTVLDTTGFEEIEVCLFLCIISV